MNTLKDKIVKISDIDFDDFFYKISRTSDNEQLKKSISVSGILDPPVLLTKDGLYKIISGFNRITIAESLGIHEFRAMVCESVNSEMFLSIARKKEYHNEIGPVGKTRLVNILMELHDNNSDINTLLLKGFGIPEFLINNYELRKFLLNLPGPLLKYIDEKNINFKVMKKLYTLPNNAIEILSEFVQHRGMKVNIFRSSIDLMDDIFRRDGNVPLLDSFDFRSEADRPVSEEELHAFYFSVRYPRFSKKLNEAEKLKSRLSSIGFSLTIPQNFEGDTLGVSFNISSDEDPGKTLFKFSRFNEDLIRSLQRLLK